MHLQHENGIWCDLSEQHVNCNMLVFGRVYPPYYILILAWLKLLVKFCYSRYPYHVTRILSGIFLLSSRDLLISV